MGLTVVAILVPACGAASGPTSPAASIDELAAQFGVSRAEMEDIRDSAVDEGWTIEEAVDRLAWQQGFADYVQALREAYPHEFAGAAILGDIGPRNGFIAFRFAVPDEVRDDPRLEHLDIEFREMLGFSEQELTEQTTVVHRAMRDAGFPDVVSGPDIPNGVIDVFAVRRVTDRGKSDQEIIAGLPPVARAGNVRIRFVDALPGGDDE